MSKQRKFHWKIVFWEKKQANFIFKLHVKALVFQEEGNLAINSSHELESDFPKIRIEDLRRFGIGWGATAGKVKNSKHLSLSVHEVSNFRPWDTPVSAFTAGWGGRTKSYRYPACSSRPGIPSSRQTDQALRAWEGGFRVESTHMWNSLCRGVRIVCKDGKHGRFLFWTGRPADP